MTTATTRSGTPVGTRRTPLWNPWPLVALLTATFMGQFDFFVVNVAAPSIQRALGTGGTGIELIVGGYAFAYASGLVTGGRLGDLLGHRRMFVWGMTAFAGASLLCGMAGAPWQLVCARLLQGLTAALMLPQVLALITRAFPAERRGTALAWYGAASGIGSIAGQVLGGLLVEADLFGLGWRTIFLINVPVGLIAAVFAFRLLPTGTGSRNASLDVVGAFGSAAALAAALIPITLSSTSGWRPLFGLLLVVGVAAALGTWMWERAVDRRGGAPLVARSLFDATSFKLGLAANAAFFLYFGSFMLTLTIMLQEALRLSPLQAGSTFTPMGAAFMATALIAKQLIARFGEGVVALGTVPLLAGLIALAVGSAAEGAGLNTALTVVALTLIGAGNGIVLPSLIGASLVGVRPQQSGVGSGVLTTVQQFASASGVAAIGAVFFSAAASGGYAHAEAIACTVQTALVAVVAAAIVLLHRVTGRDYAFDRHHRPSASSADVVEQRPPGRMAGHHERQ